MQKDRSQKHATNWNRSFIDVSQHRVVAKLDLVLQEPLQFQVPLCTTVSCQPGKQYRKVTKCYNCPNFETSVTSCHLSNAQNGWTMIHEDEQMELWNFFILKHATSTSLVLVLLELPAGPWCLRSCETLHVRNPHLFPCGQRFAWQIYNHNHVKYVKYCQIMYLDLFGYTPHLYIRILMSSLGFSYILVTCIPGDKHFSSQGVNTISQVSIFCTPSLKNSSKPDRERQLAGVWKCRVLYIVIFMWTSTNTNMEMSCLHQYRIQKGCSMMPRYSIYSCSKLAFRAAPGRNANPFTIEVWTWTSTEKIRDHFHNWLGACPGFPTGMPIDSWRN